MREPAQAPSQALGALRTALGLTTPSMLGGGNHGCTAAIDLDDDNIAIVVWHISGIEERSSFSTHGIDHAQRGPRAWCPAMKPREKGFASCSRRVANCSLEHVRAEMPIIAS